MIEKAETASLFLDNCLEFESLFIVAARARTKHSTVPALPEAAIGRPSIPTKVAPRTGIDGRTGTAKKKRRTPV
ncbi:hypothetical protein [Novosphingobium indicum]|uniref:hypothetical protein n=1 Tax=Novosphingobium indicum TaxID=462949 RepID=UPI0016680DA1|nr:hypothetical protein [Novosphingobium indicum]